MPDWRKMAREVTERRAEFRELVRRSRASPPAATNDEVEAGRQRWDAASGILSANVESISRGLRSGDPSSFRLAMEFLEADPYCDRSGYLKEEVLTVLKRPEFDERQKKWLRELILTWVQTPHGREFHYLARLAPRVADENLVDELLDLGLNSAGSKAVRARGVLHRLWCAGWARTLREKGYRSCDLRYGHRIG